MWVPRGQMTDVPNEILSGEGEIYGADRLMRRTTYRLEIYEDGGPTRIEGRVTIATEGEALVLTRADELTLLLDDGRYVAFSLVSPDGRIRAHGQLEGTEASQK